MNKLCILLVLINVAAHSDQFMMVSQESAYREGTAQWLVVGAGPAGIAAIGVLLALGVSSKSVIWVDPEFNVGRIGQFYTTVPANNKNIQFIDFINACTPFTECHTPAMEALRAADPNTFSELGSIVPALYDLSAFLCGKVLSHKGWLKELHFSNETWCAKINDYTICASHVILATGSHPRELNYENVAVIPLDHALDKKILSTYVTSENTIGVIGGSHSGILVLKYLYELNVKKIINFYRSPIVYTIDMGGWSLNAYNGLKGSTAQWAQEVLEGPNPPHNILRVYNDEDNRKQYLPECDKIIYSVGYERNETPLSEEYQHLEYDDTTGIIAPRLFGLGIAFPEYYCDPLENEDHRVGLKSFMDYAQRIIPQWVNGLGDIDAKHEQYRQQKKILEKFADIFEIDML